MTMCRRDAQLELEDDGAGRKADGLDRVTATHATFVTRLRAVAQAHAQRYGVVHIDDVRRLAAELGLAPHHPNAWGAIFRGPGWRKVGERASAVPSNHAHVSPLWAWAAAGLPPGSADGRHQPVGERGPDLGP